MASTKIFNSDSDENNWIVQTKDMVEKTDLRYLNTIPVSIYHIPKSSSSAKRECFVPQLVAIGPYDHFLPELYPMERLKIYSAKRVLEHFHQDTLEQMVKKLSKNNSGTPVRACYHKYIHIGEETLLYIMAIDGVFMLDFLHNYPKDRIFTGLQQMFQSGVKLTKDAIVRDVMMLENQIPTYMLKEILQTEGSKFFDTVDEQLGSMLLGFCIEHPPFNLKEEAVVKPSEAVEHPHLLALLYHLIVSQDGENSEWPTTQQEGKDQNSKFHTHPTRRVSSNYIFSSFVSQVFLIRVNLAGGTTKHNMGISSSNYNYYLEKITFYLGKLKASLAWTANFLETLKKKNIPLLKPIEEPIDNILKVLKHDWSLSSVSDTEAPVVVMIPSVTELRDAGIRFKPAVGGINTIEFDDRRGNTLPSGDKTRYQHRSDTEKLCGLRGIDKIRFLGLHKVH
ncbi:hypothetical protein L6164_006243 [Bauhinia variegata]|uniref:Uncharacterized protein n=1 Tax=Bauhinia variegata TaxID=167791 RepID=A0ACB9PUD7_BAUVA|nr:hypothetical protein L6164_006243 [Bauhinia variegata]